MARKLVVFLILCISACSVFGQEPVNIPDPDLKKAIEAALGISDPNADDMLKLTSFRLVRGGGGISDLTGLEYASNLTEFALGYAKISDISPLANLTNLTYLYLRYNEITDISNLAGLTNLTTLYLYDNPITDISPLANLTNLTYLHLGYNEISDISNLAGLTNLTTLYLYDNPITDITPLANLTNLTSLHAGSCNINDISFLADLTELRDLYLYNNYIEDISLLLSLTNLEKINIGVNSLNLEAYDVYIPLLFEKGIDLQCKLPSVEGVSATDGTHEDKVEITWNTFEGETFETYYKVFRAPTRLGTKTELCDWQTSKFFEDYTATPEVQYYYFVQAKIEYEDGTYLEGAYTTYDTGFIHEQYDLTISSTSGGTVVAPGIGLFEFDKNVVIQVLAEVTESDYIFAGWFGSAVDAGKVSNPESIDTTVTMSGDYTLEAVFIRDTDTIYVDDDANGLNNGLTWENAYNSLQDALFQASYAKVPITILVAQGTYTPDIGNEVTAGNREASFQLLNNVTLIGGYAGYSEPNPDARDTIQYKTILSGDLSGDDIFISDPCDLLNELTRSENSYNVVTAMDVNESAIFDGFIITAGNANSFSMTSYSQGGGMCIYKGSPTLINCIFEKNSAIAEGGGIYNYKCNSLLENCSFFENSSLDGAGIYNRKSELKLKRNVFKRNFANNGAGFYCIGSEPVLTNCLFVDNIAENSGGGVYSFSSSTPLLENCTLFGNTAKQGGGIFIHSRSDSIITNSILWNNIPNQITGNTNVTYSDIQNTWPGLGNIESEPCFVNPDLDDYHLKSTAGRWDSINKIWVIDDGTSSCIDVGDPNSDWSEELWPHGGRINMGAYGGTSQASMSLSEIGDCRDLNNDDSITWDDVLLIAEKWNSSDVPLKQDLNLDGIVDISDLAFYKDWSTDSSNAAPVFDYIEAQHIAAGNELSFSVSAIDTNSDELVYEALGLSEGAEFSEQTFTWTPEQAGTYSITFIASDYKSLDYVVVNIVVE